MFIASRTRRCCVDIQHVAELKGIAIEGGRIIVKAMTRHRELELDERVRAANPLLNEAMAHVAHIPIRNRGTVVGSLCHADGAAEVPLVLVLLGGSVLVEGPAGRREIAADEFFRFHLTTTRRRDEIAARAHGFAVLSGRQRMGLRRGHAPPRRLRDCRGRRRRAHER